MQAATNVLGTPIATPQQMYQYGLSKGAGKNYPGCFTLELCQIYYNLGKKYGIRGDIALCQSFIETGWFNFTGGTAMRPEHHNYCGLGVTTLGKVGEVFYSDTEGVSAQLQHLWAYATKNPLPSGWTLVDPRFTYVPRGTAPTWEQFGGGVWASASNYGSSILSLYNEMVKTPAGDASLTVNPSTVTLSAQQGATPPSVNVNVKGEYLSDPITFNSATSYVKVTKANNWNDYEGGTLIFTLDTSKSPITFSSAHYVAIISGSSFRCQVQLSGGITENAEPSLSISPTSISLSASHNQGTNPSTTLSVSGKNLTEDISYNSSSSAFKITPASGWNARTGGQLIVSLDASNTAGTYNATIAVQAGGKRATVSAVGTITSQSGDGNNDKIPELSFKEIWKKSTTSGNADFASSVRNMDVANGKMYCVYNTSEILIIDARTGEQTGKLPLGNVVNGGTLKLIDVVCYGDRIYACNLKSTANDELHVYEWTSESNQPSIVLSTTSTQGITRVGDCLGVSGDPNGQLVFDFAAADGSNTAIIEFTRNSGTWSSKKISVTGVAIGSSPRVRKVNNGYYLVGGSIHPTLVNSAGVKQYSLSGESVVSGNDFDTFSYDGKNYMLISTYLNTSASSLANGTMRLYEINSSWSGTRIADYPSAGLGATRNTSFSTSIATIAGTKCVEAWVLVNGQGIAYYRSGDLNNTGSNDTPNDDTINSLPDKFTTDWVYCQNNKSFNPDYLDLGGSYSRNMTLHGNNLYLVKRNSTDAEIVIADAMTGERKGTLSASGITNDTWMFSSVASLNDAILACNLSAAASATLNVYAWTSDSSTPTRILSTTNHGTRAGDLMSASGSLSNGKLYFASNSGHAGKIYVYTISSGIASSTPQVITLKNSAGEALNLGGDYAVIDIRANSDGTFYASGKGGSSGLFNADGTLIRLFDSSVFTGGNTFGSSMQVVDYGPFKLAVSTAYLANSIEQGYLALSDVSDGIDKASKLYHYPTLGQSATRNSTFVTTALAKVEGKKLHQWVMIPGQGIAKYTATSTVVGVDEIEDDATDNRIVCNGSYINVLGSEANTIALYNLSGVLVASTNSNELCIDHLPAGIYIAIARLNNGTFLSSKIVVR